MPNEEIEKLLRENLRTSKETQKYVEKIDRRQRWSRNWTMFYWGVFILLAVLGYYYAFPYLQVVSEEVGTISTQIKGFFGAGQ